jgi:hypothetical protein
MSKEKERLLKHKLRRSLVTANYPHSESDVKPVLASLAHHHHDAESAAS